MNNCKIGIDLDGVIANFAYSFTELASHVYGMRVIEDENQILDWDWSKWYGLDKKRLEKLFEMIDESDIFWMQLKLLPQPEEWNRFKTIFNLQNYDVYFITSRQNGINIKKQCEQWLEMNGWNNPTVLLSTQKELVVKGLELDYFIDDNYNTCVKVKEMNPSTTTIIRDYPYNQGSEQFIRVKNLNEFIAWIIGTY